MTHLVDWAAQRARMVLAFIALTLIAGAAAYVGLPKEGEPDIEVPALFISVPFPGISAQDSERLLVDPMEAEMASLDGLKRISATASENYALVVMEFEFGWNKSKTIADVRDKMNAVEAKFPDGAKKYTVNEFNFSQFPFIVVNLTGDVPERNLIRLAQDLQTRLEGLDAVLEANLTGARDEMVEVLIDPLKLEAYNVTAGDLITAVTQNNQLIAAGQVITSTGANSIKIPGSFDTVSDVYGLPVKTNGDRVVTLGDLATIRLTFEDRAGTARFNGTNTVSLQVVKRKGFNIIDAAAEVRAAVESERLGWPEAQQAVVNVGYSNDRSYGVASMVSQLQSSVITAIALVMIVVLASLGIRSALLVGFAIPTSFLLTFALFGLMGYSVNNIVMFGLILAVGMLVDGAIVVVEYADKRISEGVGPMHSYVEAAKRMFWPIVSSTATTLCAFLPMLFWPGVSGEFMKMLPMTLIYVLSASLLVALIYLPVVGGVAGRLSRLLDHISDNLRPLTLPLRLGLVVLTAAGLFASAMQMLNPALMLPDSAASGGLMAELPGLVLFLIFATATTISLDAVKRHPEPQPVIGGYRRNFFGRITAFLTGNPFMPFVTIIMVIAFVGTTFVYYGTHNKGTTFFTDIEPEQAIVYVRARGDLSVEEKDAIVRRVEDAVRGVTGVKNAFAFAGADGVRQNTAGASGPRDAIGQVQVETYTWETRPVAVTQAKLLGLIPYEKREVDPAYSGQEVVKAIEARLSAMPGVRFEVMPIVMGPASAKPVHLRLTGDDWASLDAASELAHQHFNVTPGLTDVEDSRPLPGLDWQLDVDVETAGRYGTNVATVGGMVQLVTNGLLLDTMRIQGSDQEIEIRVRLPEEDRLLSTLDSLKLRTPMGLVPLSNFVTRTPVPRLAQIDRVDQKRFYDVKAGLADGLVRLAPKGQDGPGEVMREAEADQIMQAEPGGYTRIPVTANERIASLTDWLNTAPLPDGISWEWTGDQAEQQDSQAFLSKAFTGALFLMFIILLAQFNSFYNAVLVLLAVVLSTTGVLVGMLVLGQPFSVIMTGTGIVALAGIVVNNNIVLIDTYQEYASYMPRLEAISRTAQDRIRPVFLTTFTTMAGLMPMMFGLSFDFIHGGYSIDAPTALWWKQLAAAVVFGLGIATVLTLVFTPAMLAIRVWIEKGAYGSVVRGKALIFGRHSRAAQDLALRKSVRKAGASLGELNWAEDESTEADEGDDAPDLAALEAVIRVREHDTPAEGEAASPDEDCPDSDAGDKPIRAAE
ncbi:MAG: efflux RND transporter permease subunit [Maritimibacter sp.]